MKDLKETHKDWIGIYPNAATEEYCSNIIDRYKYHQGTRPQVGGGGGFIISRQEEQSNMDKTLKDGDTLFLGSESVGGPANQIYEGPLILHQESPLIREFHDATWECYKKYKEQYPAVSAVSKHQMDNAIRVQKTAPGQGYHMWHSDGASSEHSDRMLGIILYLNDVEEGGETEFLYQKMRIRPQQGTLVLFPTSFQYIHRGNPPLTNDKYILTTWLKYIE